MEDVGVLAQMPMICRSECEKITSLLAGEMG